MDKHKTGSRWLISLLTLSVLVIVSLYMYTTFFASRFQGTLEKRLYGILERRVYIERVFIAPAFGIGFKNLKILNKDNQSLFFEAKRLVLKYSPLDLFFGRFNKVSSIQLTQPRLYLGEPFLNIKNLRLPIFKKIQLDVENGALTFGNSTDFLKGFWGKLEIKDDRIEFRDFKTNIASMPVDVRGHIADIYNVPEFNLHLSSNSAIYAMVDLKGPISNSMIDGWISLFGKPKRVIKGSMHIENGTFKLKDLTVEKLYSVNLEADLNQFNFMMDISGYKDSLDGFGKSELDMVKLRKEMLGEEAQIIPKERQFLFYLSLKHVDILGYDILLDTYLFGKIHFKNDYMDKVRGTLITRNTLVDFTPIGEFNSNFEYKEGILTLERFSFGDSFDLTGTLNLKMPFNVNAVVKLTELDLSNLVMFTSQKIRDSVSGTLSGDITIEHILLKPRIKGRLHARNGKLGFVDYRIANVNLEGEGSELKILDSQILRDQGYFMLDGFMDLRQLGRVRFLEGLRVRSDEKTVVWEGWNIVKEARQEEELDLQKNIGEGFKINFKKFINDEVYAQSDAHDELELEYKLKSNKSFKMRLRDQEETLQLEQRVKF